MAYIETIDVNNENYLNKIEKIENGTGCIIINTPFDKNELTKPFKFDSKFQKYIDYINGVIFSAIRKLKIGGYIFVYGLPKWLPYFAKKMNEDLEMSFKYWIALDIAEENQAGNLTSSHVGMLMYVKGKNAKFPLNTDVVRIPYVACSACGKNIKDWGGKKHLINKLGACVSDVWKDFNEVIGEIEDPQIEELKLKKIDSTVRTVKDFSTIPNQVLERVMALVDNGELFVNINCDPVEIEIVDLRDQRLPISSEKCDLPSDIYLGDSIEVMKEWIKRYPEGCFDLIFADPPYNLDKDYSDYSDNEADSEYIDWCNEWLTLCSKLLRPGGSMFILNLPKWAIYHVELLNKELFFRNWIVWDALSVPKGKIMPAHYALLYYTKDQEGKFNNNEEITWVDTSDYCLRASCIKKRKNVGDDKKVYLSDIWTDISRIKHKRDRDDHPCQLPEKLMERIITLFSDEGDFVFDPFSGAGTTPIVAKKLGRRYAAIDVSEDYVMIGRKKIQQIEEYGDVIKQSVKKTRRKVTKKSIELYIQNVCINLGYRPEENEFLKILANDEAVLFTEDDIIQLYGDLKTALKSGRIVMKHVE